MSPNQIKPGQNRLLALAVLVAAFSLLCTTSVLAATTYVAAATGNWNANSTWTPNTGHPVAGDTATISGAFTVTVNDAEACATLNVNTSASAKLQVQTGGTVAVSGLTTIALGNITVDSGGTATLTTGTLTTGTIANNGTMSFSGAITGTGTTLTQGTSASLTFGGAVTAFPLSASASGNTVVYNGTAAQAVNAATGGAGGYYNLNIGTAVATPATLAGSTTAVAGNLEILSGGELSIANSKTLNVTGTTTIDSTGTLLYSGSSPAGTLTGNVTVNGTLSFASLTTGAVTISGTTTVNGTVSFGAAAAALTFAGDVTLASGSTWSETAAAKPFFGGSFFNNGATTFTISTGVHTFKGATPSIGGTSVAAFNSVTFGDGVNGCNPTSSGAGFTIATALTIAAGNATYANAGTLTVPTVTVNGSAVNNGTITAATLLTIATPGSLVNNGTITATTALSGTGTLTQGANSTLNLGGTAGITTLTATASGNTVNYNKSGTQTANTTATTYYNLSLSGTSAKTLPAALTTVSGNLTLSGSATTTLTANLAIGGNLSIGDGTTFTVGAFTLGVTGTTTVGAGTSGTLTISSATGTKTFSGAVTINTGGALTAVTGSALVFGADVTVSGTFTETTAPTASFAGNLTVNSGSTFTAGTGVQTFTGTSKSIQGTVASVSIPSATFSGTYTLGGSVATLTVGTALAGTGSFTLPANDTLNIGGTSTISTLTATATGSTVNYTGTAQTILGTSYYNLTTSGSGIKTLGGTTSVGNTLTIGASTTLAGSTFTLNLAGNLVNNGAFTANTSTVNFNGSVNQAVTNNAVTFNNVTVNNTGSSGNNTVTVYGGAVSGSTTVNTGHFVIIGPVAELIWSTPPPASVSPNTVITPFPVIQTADANGNPSTIGLGAHQIITVSLGGSGTLAGTTNFDIGTGSTNGSTGTVICSNLSVSGGGAITLVASPGNGLNPASIPGICLWLDGSDTNSMTFSGSTITAWNDKSGNGKNFNTTFSTTPPGPITLTAGTTNLNGRTGVMFPGNGTGSGSSLACTNLTINNTTLSVYVMVKQVISINNFFRLCAFANASEADAGVSDTFNFELVNPNLELVGPGFGSIVGSGVAIPAVGTPWLGKTIFNGTTVSLALLQKGAALETSSGSSTVSLNLTAAAIAGALNAGDTTGGGYWSSPVYEYLVYSNALSTANQSAVETYLTNKWVPIITNNAVASLSIIVPSASAGSPQAICNGGSVQIGGSPTASGGSGSGYTYSWSPSTGLSSTNVANPTASPTATTTYSVTVTDGGGGVSAPATVVVTVNPSPTITLGASPTVDAGSTTANLPYTATSNSPDQYEILYDAAAHTAGFTDVSSWTTLPATPIPLTVPGGASTGTYYGTNYVQNSTTGCASVANPFTVTLSQPYSAYTITAASSTPTAGAGDVLTITAVDSTGTTVSGVSGINISLTFSGMAVIGANQPTYNGTAQTSPVTLSFSGGQATVTLAAYSANGGSAQTPHVTDGSHADTSTGGSSQALTVAPTAASQLVFTSSPVTATAGTASGSITVQRQDPYGNPNTTDAGISVALSSSSTGTVVFNPASPLNIAQGSSSASFTYSDTKAGSPVITAANGGWPSVTQSETITAGSASQLIVTLPGETFTPFSGNSGTASAQTATTPFNITLTAVDAYTNIDTSYTNAQTVSYSGPTGSGNVYTTNVTFNSGHASGLATMINSAQTCAITPSISGGPAGVTSSSFTVGPDAISINFGSDVQAMNVGDTAGVIPLAHWNNASGPSVTVNNLLNLGGTASSASVAVSCPGTWHADNGTADGNHKMLTGYVDQQGTITVTNLPSAITDSYSVYVYVGADGNGRQGSVNIGGTTNYFSTAAFSFDNGGGGAIAPDTFVRATSTTSGTYTPGNYVLFTGLSGSSFTIAWAHVSINCGVFGVQIVATPRTPSATAVSSSANPSGYGQSVTFTAAVTANVTATGNVIFKADGTPFGTNTLNGSDIATFTTSSLARGTRTITAEYPGDAGVFGSTNNLSGGQVVTNHPPVAVDDNLTRNSGGVSMKILLSSLLANDTDPDAGDTLHFDSISATTTNGGSISNDSTYIYVPASSVNDAFTYTIDDGQGGTNTGNVFITIVSATGQQTIVTPTPSNATAVFFGVPGVSYTVQRATNVTFDGGVSNFPSTAAPSNGVFSITDNFSDLGAVPASAFYRLLVP